MTNFQVRKNLCNASSGTTFTGFHILKKLLKATTVLTITTVCAGVLLTGQAQADSPVPDNFNPVGDNFDPSTNPPAGCKINCSSTKPVPEPVPEPLTILGTLAAGSIGVALRRKYQQQKDTTKV